MGCASCAQKYAALKASRTKTKDQSPVDMNEPRTIKPARRGILRKSSMKPIVPTEGVDVGTIVPNTGVGDLDPSTGQEKSVIKTGKSTNVGAELDGSPKPDSLGSTPPLQTPVTD